MSAQGSPPGFLSWDFVPWSFLSWGFLPWSFLSWSFLSWRFLFWGFLSGGILSGRALHRGLSTGGASAGVPAVSRTRRPVAGVRGLSGHPERLAHLRPRGAFPAGVPDQGVDPHLGGVAGLGQHVERFQQPGPVARPLRGGDPLLQTVD